MGWLKKWWWLPGILAIALIIGWEEKRCQANSYQCRANYVAQSSSSGTIYERASEQQAIAAACEPNSYFCRLFSAANLPTMFLVFIGVGGIWAALITLSAIKGQTRHIARQALSMRGQTTILRDSVQASRKGARAALFNAKAVINAERAWIVVSVESPEPNKFNFRATNVGKTPAKIKSIWSRPITFWRDSELEIPPDEKTGESLLSTPPCLLPPTDSQIVLRCDIGELGPGQYIGPDASDRVKNDIQKGFRMLYFYGRIIYSDTLDEKSLHETKWLYWYLAVGDGAAAIPDPRHPELNSYS